MFKVNYNVGDIIQYRTFSGTVRSVLVEEKDDDVKNGRPGFAGRNVSASPGDAPHVWGYDADIIRVVKKKTES